jgi:hypothetical protein
MRIRIKLIYEGFNEKEKRRKVKHLKSYTKLFESQDELPSIDDVISNLIKDINEICLELNDIDISTDSCYNNPYFLFSRYFPGSIRIWIGDRFSESFNYKWLDVKEVVLRLISYLELNNFELETMSRSQDSFPIKIFLKEDDNSNFNFTCLIIDFKQIHQNH